MKDLLATQKSQAEAEVSRLKSELKVSLGQKEKLHQELESQKEKLSQSAFTLNDLHMGKQQLEATVRELRDKLKKSQELSKEMRVEASELKKLLQERETQLDVLRQEQSRAEEQGDEVKCQMKVLEEKEKEIQDVRRELVELKVLYEKVSSEDFELKLENRKLKENHVQALEKLENLDQQLQDGQASLSTRIEALKLEKNQLEVELSQAENRLLDQAKQYQKTIEELTKARSLDASALQMEHERAVTLNQEKDLTIAKLKRDLEQMVADHKDTSEMLDMTVAGQKQLAELLEEKDAFAASLKAQADEAQKDLEARISLTKQENDALRKVVEEKDKQLGAMKEKNSHLKEEIDRLKDQQSRPQLMSEPRTLDIITELETEVAQLKAARDRFEEEARTLRATSEQQRESLIQSQHVLQVHQSELEQARSRHEQSTLNYEKLIGAKDEEITRLQGEMERLSVQSQPRTMEILQEDKTRSLSGENGNEKHDLSKVEIEKLVKGIKEKETEIIQLNEKNLSLTKQLDQLVVSHDELGKLSQIVLQKDLEIQALHARVSGGYSQDVQFLQQQMQAYAVEREQVLAVLNEKTRENSHLRSEYHRIMEIIAAKESALLKLQQENQRLSTMSDPSGSQEMFRETIQNLSRIIREKDIEIDALTQKCQTLVTVLQASSGDSGSSTSGGVSSNQFEELLHERDNLKQQVKKMDEWKQQVITTVKNMQHESAQLQEELLKLQGQVSADSDCSSKLSVDYSRLIQSYEQKEKRLGSLSQELAQVQQTISQLSTTKDVLLGKLDSVTQVPDISPQSGQTLGYQVAQDAPPSRPAVQDENLRQELESLRRTLAEKESMLRTLQENNHRLSNSASLSESEQRGHAEELRQAWEKIDTLQRSLREKDLLIKTKGDQLNQVSLAYILFFLYLG